MAVFGLTLGYQIKGADDSLAVEKMQIAFERTAEGLERFGEYLFPRLNVLFEEELSSQFEAEGHGPIRGKWPALTKEYARWKTNSFPGRKILELSGNLKGALTSTTANSLRVESGNQFNFGTQGLEYASFHQTGTARMVDRPPFDFRSEFEDKLLQAGKDAAREVLSEAGVEAAGVQVDL